MPATTFTWMPDLGATRTVEPTVETAKFGDGYEQRVGLGLNRQLRTWKMTFTGVAEKAVSILDFLEARDGSESFNWTDPMDVTAIYVCRKWDSSQIKEAIYAVNCDFEQVPA